MTKVSVEYTGDLHCKLTHEKSGSVIYTDAPTDIGGKGETFSPTDLIAASLASCILTTLANAGEKKGWNFTGMHTEIVKEMVSDPKRRINRLPIDVWMPINVSQEEKILCEEIAQTCPVHKSLHPSIEIVIILHWPNKD